MQRIGYALSQLPDNSSRQRVLRWALDRFEAARPAAETAATAPSADRREATRREDPSLTLDGVSLFEESEADMPASEEPEAGLENLIKGFVSDFRRVAVEWQGA